LYLSRYLEASTLINIQNRYPLNKDDDHATYYLMELLWACPGIV